MAKRDSGNSSTSENGTAMTADMERRVLAFAEQLGRIVGTVQAKTEGLVDREALNKQIASVRDTASELLDQLADGVTNLTKSAEKTAKNAVASAKNLGRSGGIVDAPGKKHRKPTPKDPRAMAADAKGANMRAGKASMKTTKKRGRG